MMSWPWMMQKPLPGSSWYSALGCHGCWSFPAAWGSPLSPHPCFPKVFHYFCRVFFKIMNFVSYLRFFIHTSNVFWAHVPLNYSQRPSPLLTPPLCHLFGCQFILVTCEGCFELLLYLYVIGCPVMHGQLTTNHHLPVAPQRWVLWAPCLHARMLIGLLLFRKPQMLWFHEGCHPVVTGRHLFQFSPVPASYRFSDPFLRNVINRNSFWALAHF